ncbi:MAG: hypothetical protein VKP72_08595 [bacterium]|nr:hypothetical protein [bacterium]
MPTAEPTPVASPTPDPEPPSGSPASPTPAPVPPEPVAWPAPRLTTELAWIDEHVAFEALRVAVNAVPHLQLDWCPSWAGWRLPVSVGAHAFQFASTDYPGVFHRREVTTGAIALVRDHELGPLRLATGLGWGGTWNRITSTSGPPAPPAASQFWFTPVLDLRGWGIRQEIVWPLGPELALGLDLAWTPGEDVTAAPGSGLPRMSGYRIAPVVSFGSGLVHRAGMFLESHVGGDFPSDPQGVGSGFATTRFGLMTSIGLGTLERTRVEVAR